MVERPERVATQQTMPGQVLAAAATAAAAIATRQAVEYLVRRVIDWDRPTPAPKPNPDARPLKAA
jgi:hypothetical protein